MASVYGVFLLLLDFCSQKFKFLFKSPPMEQLTATKGLRGRVAIVTGGNSGIGKETVRGLAAAGAQVILACRTASKGDATAAEIFKDFPGAKIDVEVLDLASFASIRAFAARIATAFSHIDILVLNAGVLGVPFQITQDDVPDLNFATNHVGHFLLTILLLPLLRTKSNTGSRIVVLSSIMGLMDSLQLEDMDYKQRPYSKAAAYSNSKTCNMLFVQELSRRLKNSSICINGVHPGIVATPISQNLHWFSAYVHTVVIAPFLLNEEVGAWTSLYVATSPNIEGVTGKFFWRMNEQIKTKGMVDDPKLAAELWNLSVRLCRLSEQETALLP